MPKTKVKLSENYFGNGFSICCSTPLFHKRRFHVLHLSWQNFALWNTANYMYYMPKMSFSHMMDLLWKNTGNNAVIPYRFQTGTWSRKISTIIQNALTQQSNKLYLLTISSISHCVVLKIYSKVMKILMINHKWKDKRFLLFKFY